MRQNGTYALLEEEIARAKALDFLVENAAPAPMPEEEEVVPGPEETGTSEAKVQTGATENKEREEG
jgi:hypothetical protein